ncbi:SsgA family sporulation/cell division regulator [Kitasatospora sp. NPDC002227]|uniref:SsgA family sporulation/cell division regulator n=1 Tax=Kitasatospora sp. NPDC002227 TaxID=3154773 RepID=UPI003334A6EB
MTYHDVPPTPPSPVGIPDCAVIFRLHAVTFPGLSVPVLACLRYHRDDPYAVYLDNHVDLEDPVTWVFGREILAAGLDGWSGTGDVSVYPEVGGGLHSIMIALSDDDATALLRAPALLVREFLAETEQVVPFGAESQCLDMDALIAHLLGEEDIPLA